MACSRKRFFSGDLRKKVMPIISDFEEYRATPCYRRLVSGAFDLVRGQALIVIEEQPKLLVHLVGFGKLDGQVADERAQHRVGLAELSPAPAPHARRFLQSRSGSGRDRHCSRQKSKITSPVLSGLPTIFMTRFISKPRCSNRHPKRVSDIVTTFFPYLACSIKYSAGPKPHALHHLDKPEPACQHHIMLSCIDFFI